MPAAQSSPPQLLSSSGPRALSLSAPQPLSSLLLILLASSLNLCSAAQQVLTPSQSLKSILESAQDGAVISLGSGVYAGPQTCGAIVSSNVTLQADLNASAPVVVDCSGSGRRALTIQAAYITIIGIEFRGGVGNHTSPEPFGGSGGCLALDSSTLNLKDSTFTGCQSSGVSTSYSGGAIFATRSSTLKIERTSFIQCSGALGAGIAADNSQLDILDSNFLGGGSMYGGGLYLASSTLKVQGGSAQSNSAVMGGFAYLYASTFTTSKGFSCSQNSASQRGACFYAAGANSNPQTCVVSLEASSFTNNQGSALDSYGAIFFSYCTATISETEVSGNLGDWGGGFTAVRSTVMVLEGTRMNSNRAYMNGGAAYLYLSTMYAEGNVEFDSNIAGDAGTFYVFNAMAHLSKGVRVTRGQAFYWASWESPPRWMGTGGAALLNSGALLVAENGVLFDQCSSGFEGGAVTLFGSFLEFNGGVTLSNCRTSSFGGALNVIKLCRDCLPQSTVDITGDNTFYNNMATGAQSNGGAIYSWRQSIVNIGGNTVFAENAAGYGGAISMETGKNEDETIVGYLMLRGNTQFVNNTCSFNGGAVGVNFYTDLYIRDEVKFIDNSAGGTAGAINVQGFCAIRVDGNPQFIQNSANLGGAIHGFEAKIFIGQDIQDSDILFKDNIAATNGGAILLQEQVELQATNARFLENEAFRGGSIAIMKGSSAYITDNLHEGNDAWRGGAIYVHDAFAKLKGSTIQKNGRRVSAFGGGAYVLTHSSVVIEDCTLRENWALLKGGGLAIMNSAEVTISGSDFESNVVRGICENTTALPCGGGGILAQDQAKLSLGHDTRVRKNLAASGGGVLLEGNAHLTIEGTIVEENQAESHGGGGGIGVFNQSALHGKGGVLIRNNTAHVGRGGGLFVSGVTFELDGTTLVEDNKAMDGGGIFLLSSMNLLGDPDLVTSKTTLKGNLAADNGGGLHGTGSQARCNAMVGHSLEFSENEATNGGGLFLSEGALLVLEEETCDSSCVSEARDNGQCDIECMRRSCNWDNGECGYKFNQAGYMAPFKCPRQPSEDWGSIDVCTQFIQMTQCAPACFSSMCDWNMEFCEGLHDMYSCPIFDAWAYQSLMDTPGFISTRGGTTQSIGRCMGNWDENCNAPTAQEQELVWALEETPEQGSDNYTSSNSSTTAPTGLGNGEPRSSVTLDGQTVLQVDGQGAALAAKLSEIGVELWLKLGPWTLGNSLPWRQHVFMSDYLELSFLSVSPNSYLPLIAVNQEEVISRGIWTSCRPERTTITSTEGFITDGAGNYSNNMNCEIVIAPKLDPGETLALSWLEFDTEWQFDELFVQDCSDSTCSATVGQEQRFHGILSDRFTEVVSATGILLLRFTSDTQGHRSGFTGKFQTLPAGNATRKDSLAGATIEQGAWAHVAFTLNSDSGVQLHVNGRIVANGSSSVATPFSFMESGFTLGRGWVSETGMVGSIDCLKIWEKSDLPVATPSCPGPTERSELLLACLDFSEGNGSTVRDTGRTDVVAQGVRGEKYRPWCQTYDLNGTRWDFLSVGVYSDLGESWGFCAPEDRPKLPVSYYAYDPDVLTGLPSLTAQQMFEQHPGCGLLPLSFKNNLARMHGGGMYASCNQALALSNKCSFTGMSIITGAAMVRYEANKALAAGGAVYIDCNDLGAACREQIEQELSVATDVECSSIDPGKCEGSAKKKVLFMDNIAQAYQGQWQADVATAPSVLEILRDGDELGSSQTLYVPGQDPLNLAIVLRDDIGSSITGSETVPNPYVISARICRFGKLCTTDTALTAPGFHKYPVEWSDPVLTTTDLIQDVLCPIDEDTVEVVVELVSSCFSISSESITINCTQCQEGQSLHYVPSHTDPNQLLQKCEKCAPGSYSIDPNKHPCNQCPIAVESCDSVRVVDDRGGGTWTKNYTLGVWTLAHCPAGSQRVVPDNSNPSWHLNQRCHQCGSTEYVVEPDIHECQPCPVGWPVNCGTGITSQTSTLVNADDNNAVWEIVGQHIRLKECTNGYILVRDPLLPEQDQCVQCPVDTFRTEGAKWMEPEERNFGVVTRAANAFAQCVVCFEQTKCPGGNILLPRKNWFRFDNDGLESRRQDSNSTSFTELNQLSILPKDFGVYPCPPHSCQDGGGCSEGHTGPVCGLCLEGWSMAFGRCSECQHDFQTTERIVLLSGVSALVILLFFMAWRPLFFWTPDDMEQERLIPRVKAALKRLIFSPRATLPITGWSKIIIGFYQVLSSYVVTFSVDWPESHQDLMSTAGISRLDLMGFPGPNCLVATYSYTTKLLIYTLSLPVFVFLLAWPTWVLSAYSYLVQGHVRASPRYGTVVDLFWWSSTFSMFMTYPTLAYVVLRTFHCQDLGYLGNYLVADYAELCPNDFKTDFVFVYALCAVGVFPLGIPVLFLGVLEYYGVPRIANTKHNTALVQALILLYKKQSTSHLSMVVSRHLDVQEDGKVTRKFEKRVSSLFQILVLSTQQEAARAAEGQGKHTPLRRAQSFRFGTRRRSTAASAESSPERKLETPSQRPGDFSPERKSLPSAHVGAESTEDIPPSLSADQIIDTARSPRSMQKLSLRTASKNSQGSVVSEDRSSIEVDEASPKSKRPPPLAIGGPDVTGTNLASPAESAAEKEISRTVILDYLRTYGMEPKEEVFVQGLLSEYSGSSKMINYVQFKATLIALVNQSHQFTGLETLVALSDEQLSILVNHDWTQQTFSNRGRRGSHEGGRRNSHDSGTLLSVPATPEAGTALIHSAPPTPQARNDRERQKFSKRKASLIGQDTSDMDTGTMQQKVLEIAHRLQKTRLIAIPTLEWDGSSGPEEELAIKRVGFLFFNYRVECWYYEVLEVLRKLISTVGVVFVYPGSPTQVAVGFFVTFFFLMVAARLKPYVDHRLEEMQLFSLGCLCMTLFYGIMLMLQQQGERPAPKSVEDAVSLLFLIFNLSVPLYPLYQLWAESKFSLGHMLRALRLKYDDWITGGAKTRHSSFIMKTLQASSFLRRSSDGKSPKQKQRRRFSQQSNKVNQMTLVASQLEAGDSSDDEENGIPQDKSNKHEGQSEGRLGGGIPSSQRRMSDAALANVVHRQIRQEQGTSAGTQRTASNSEDSQRDSTDSTQPAESSAPNGHKPSLSHSQNGSNSNKLLEPPGPQTSMSRRHRNITDVTEGHTSGSASPMMDTDSEESIDDVLDVVVADSVGEYAAQARQSGEVESRDSRFLYSGQA